MAPTSSSTPPTSDPQDAERESGAARQWVGDEGEQSEGPAENEKDAEEKEFCHGGISIRDPSAGAGLRRGRSSRTPNGTQLSGAEFPFTTEDTESTERSSGFRRRGLCRYWAVQAEGVEDVGSGVVLPLALLTTPKVV